MLFLAVAQVMTTLLAALRRSRVLTSSNDRCEVIHRKVPCRCAIFHNACRISLEAALRILLVKHAHRQVSFLIVIHGTSAVATPVD